MEESDFDVPKLGTYFKYHGINDHLLELLQNGEFYYSNQEELGDVFDLNLIDHITPNFFKKYFESYGRMKFHEMRAKSREEIGDRIDHLPPHFILSDESKFVRFFGEYELSRDNYAELLKNSFHYGVCCFTSDHNNFKMWDEYASRHSGVCLEFDLSTKPEIFNNLFPVKYHDEKIEVNTTVDLYKLVFSKKLVYAHEKEWRHPILFHKKFPFNKLGLKKIYFGVKTSEQDKLIIMKLIKSDPGYNVESFEHGVLYRGQFSYISINSEEDFGKLKFQNI